MRSLPRQPASGLRDGHRARRGRRDVRSASQRAAMTRTADPVPLQPHSDREAFGYGYTGGTPTTTYLLRPEIGRECRLGGIGLTAWHW
jgi:hypothetical protein